MSGVAYLWKEGLVSQIGWWKDAREWMQRQTVGRWRGDPGSQAPGGQFGSTESRRGLGGHTPGPHVALKDAFQS